MVKEVTGFQKLSPLKRMTLNNLPFGKWRYFALAEMDTINQMLKNSSKTAEGREGKGWMNKILRCQANSKIELPSIFNF